jgi:hypothetical protein
LSATALTDEKKYHASSATTAMGTRQERSRESGVTGAWA